MYGVLAGASAEEEVEFSYTAFEEED
jgi:hypothetical protein